jgi:hypothetical protein
MASFTTTRGCAMRFCVTALTISLAVSVCASDPATKDELLDRIKKAQAGKLQADQKIKEYTIELYRLGAIPKPVSKSLSAVLVLSPPVKKGEKSNSPRAEYRYTLDDYGWLYGTITISESITNVGMLGILRRDGEISQADMYVVISQNDSESMVAGDVIKVDDLCEITSLVAIKNRNEKVPVLRLIKRYKIPR